MKEFRNRFSNRQREEPGHFYFEVYSNVCHEYGHAVFLETSGFPTSTIERKCSSSTTTHATKFFGQWSSTVASTKVADRPIHATSDAPSSSATTSTAASTLASDQILDSEAGPGSFDYRVVSVRRYFGHQKHLRCIHTEIS